MSQPYLQVIAHYFVRPGHGDEVSGLLGELAQMTRSEPANLYYQFFRSVEDPNHFVILERYSHAQGLEEHRNTSHFQQIGVQRIIPLLTSREVQSHMVGNSD